MNTSKNPDKSNKTDDTKSRHEKESREISSKLRFCHRCSRWFPNIFADCIYETCECYKWMMYTQELSHLTCQMTPHISNNRIDDPETRLGEFKLPNEICYTCFLLRIYNKSGKERTTK